MELSALSSLGLSSDWVVCFGLLACRTGGWIVVVPLLGARGVVAFIRAAVALVLAFALTPVALAGDPHLPAGALAFGAAAVGEVLVGALTGWLTGMLFSAAEMAGGLADLTSGLSYASLVDPNSGASSSSFSRLFSTVFLAIAFAADAHHGLVKGLASTLQAVPAGVWPAFDTGLLPLVLSVVTTLMRAAIEIGAPLLGALFLTEVALGLVGKFYPQANILVTGMSLKALVAIATAGLALSLLPQRIAPMLEFGASVLAGVF